MKGFAPRMHKNLSMFWNYGEKFGLRSLSVLMREPLIGQHFVIMLIRPPKTTTLMVPFDFLGLKTYV